MSGGRTLEPLNPEPLNLENELDRGKSANVGKDHVR